MCSQLALDFSKCLSALYHWVFHVFHANSFVHGVSLERFTLPRFDLFKDGFIGIEEVASNPHHLYVLEMSHEKAPRDIGDPQTSRPQTGRVRTVLSKECWQEEAEPQFVIRPIARTPAFNLLKHGQREPIRLYQDQIIDGRNRYRACQRLAEEDLILVQIGIE